jgi:hypothetical protein
MRSFMVGEWGFLGFGGRGGALGLGNRGFRVSEKGLVC